MLQGIGSKFSKQIACYSYGQPLDVHRSLIGFLEGLVQGKIAVDYLCLGALWMPLTR